jgi:hypothetical protein
MKKSVIKNTDKHSVEYSFSHCVERFKERYDGILTREMYDFYNAEIIRFINSNFKTSGSLSLELINKSLGTPTSYTIKIKDGRDIYASFEKERNRITTLFPPESVKRKK